MESIQPSSSKSGRVGEKSKGGKAQDGRGQTFRERSLDDDGWGGFKNYMQAKKMKLNDQFDKDLNGRESNIFAGVYIYVNGYTNPSSDELRKLMREHGGRYETYLSMTRVTHIVASNLPNSKFKMAKTMPIVKPSWITDSVAAGRRLSHVPYLLLGNQSRLQPGLKSFSSVSSLRRSSSSSSSSAVLKSESSLLADSAFSEASHIVKGKQIAESTLQASSRSINGPKENRITPQSTSKDCLQTLSEPEHILSDNHLKGSRKCKQSGNHLPCVEAPCKEKYERDIQAVAANDISRVKTDMMEKEIRGNVHIYSYNVASKHESEDDDIVYNSGEDSSDPFVAKAKCDSGEDDIVYDSGDNSSDPFVAKYSEQDKTYMVPKPNLMRRSRVYSLRKMKKKSGSFDSVRSENTSSCDGFSDFLPPDQTNLAETVSLSGNKDASNQIMPFQVNTSVSSQLTESASKHSIDTMQETCSLRSVAKNPEKVSGHLHEGPGGFQSLYNDMPQQTTATSSESQPTSVVGRTGQTSSINFPLTNENLQVSEACSSDSNIVLPPLPAQQETTSSKPDPPSSHNTKSPNSKSRTMGKAGDKGFLQEFYSNSRLHHISTWGAEFKAYVAEIQKAGEPAVFPGRERLRKAHEEAAARLSNSESLGSPPRRRPSGRVVMHIDMDCFFVSVGLLDRPDLRGKPVAVTHSKGQGGRPSASSNLAWERAEWMKKREGKLKGEKAAPGAESSSMEDGEGGFNGYDFQVPKGSTGVETFYSMAEIASCSYEARKAGVKNGTFMGRALKLCPELQTIPYNFAEYNRISRILYDLVASYTHDIEAVSCDEMLIDCTDILTDTGATALEFARLLRSEMMAKTGCPASAGIGPNILMAKLATRKAKPNGQFEVLSSEAKKFIKDQPVAELPGVGYSMTSKLAKLGVDTCGQLQGIPLFTLRREFGPKTGEVLHRYSLGQDDRPVRGDKQRKSVSAEVNYGIRFSKESEALTFLQELSGEVKNRMDAIHVKGRCITLKLMVRRPDAPTDTAKFMGHGICNTLNKSCNLPTATNDGELIAREVIALYKSQRVLAPDLRGIGIQVNKLEGQSTAQTSSNTSGHQSILNFAVSKAAAPAMSNSSVQVSGSETVGTTQHASVPFRDQMSVNTPQQFVDAHALPQPGPSRIRDELKTGSDTRSMQYVNLSFSQIDADTLQELPEDIAKEVLSDLEHQKKRVSNQADSVNDENKFVEGSHGALPSLSQLNLSCLEALPEFLQEEIKAEYNRLQPGTNLKLSRNAQDNCFTRLISPKKSPRKQGVMNQRGAKQKGKRGRPPGKKKLDFGTKRLPRVGVQKQAMNVGFVGYTDARICEDSNGSQGSMQQENSRDFANVDNTSDSRDKGTKQKSMTVEDNQCRPVEPRRASLCGAVALKEVRPLVKEWLSSGNAPQEDDLAMVTNFLSQLIEFKDLELAYPLLKLIHRQSFHINSAEWKECLQNLVASIQSVVCAFYGACFKL